MGVMLVYYYYYEVITAFHNGNPGAGISGCHHNQISFLVSKFILLLAKYIANLESSLPMKSKHLPNGLFRSSTLIRSNLRELSGHRVKRF